MNDITPKNKSKNNIVMFNPKNNVKVVTNQEFKSHWEKLGFTALSGNVVLFKVAI